MKTFDVIIIGAGAAGLFCAAHAAQRGRSVLVIDHANKAGKKILMSGGGYCNFTNYNISPDRYISQNPHFCKSALSRYTQWDFIDYVKQYQIPFHEKGHGELFCDNKSKDILTMLLHLCQQSQVKIELNCSVQTIEKNHQFTLATNQQHYQCQSLVIATGGLSIPTMGASPFGYQVAEQFDLTVNPVRAGLVPFTCHDHDKEKYATLSGVSVHSMVRNQRISFTENILFTHRGLSGPAILQISSYWQPGEAVTIDMLPEFNIHAMDELHQSSQHTQTFLANYLPKRVITIFCPESLLNRPLKSLSAQEFQQLFNTFKHWQLKPNATEGYRTAEVTLGGVDCNAISSKTFESQVENLYFIGEVLDVTGWLGGYNFQWAWSSAWAAAQYV